MQLLAAPMLREILLIEFIDDLTRRSNDLDRARRVRVTAERDLMVADR